MFDQNGFAVWRQQRKEHPGQARALDNPVDREAHELIQGHRLLHQGCHCRQHLDLARRICCRCCGRWRRLSISGHGPRRQRHAKAARNVCGVLGGMLDPLKALPDRAAQQLRVALHDRCSFRVFAQRCGCERGPARAIARCRDLRGQSDAGHSWVLTALQRHVAQQIAQLPLVDQHRRDITEREPYKGALLFRGQSHARLRAARQGLELRRLAGPEHQLAQPCQQTCQEHLVSTVKARALGNRMGLASAVKSLHQGIDQHLAAGGVLRLINDRERNGKIPHRVKAQQHHSTVDGLGLAALLAKQRAVRQLQKLGGQPCIPANRGREIRRRRPGRIDDAGDVGHRRRKHGDLGRLGAFDPRSNGITAGVGGGVAGRWRLARHHS